MEERVRTKERGRIQVRARAVCGILPASRHDSRAPAACHSGAEGAADGPVGVARQAWAEG